MRRTATRSRPALAFLMLAWLAQLCLPLAHALAMASPQAQELGFCGDRDSAAAYAAELPPELREALGLDAGAASLNAHAADCAAFCTSGPPPLPSGDTQRPSLRAVSPPPPRAAAPAPRLLERALIPPAQGPPARG